MNKATKQDFPEAIKGQLLDIALKYDITLSLGDGMRPGLLMELADVDANLEPWKQTLVAAAYRHCVGPRLTHELAPLHDSVPQVLAWWQATQAACSWLAELCWSIHTTAAAHRTVGAPPWQTLSSTLALSNRPKHGNC